GRGTGSAAGGGHAARRLDGVGDGRPAPPGTRARAARSTRGPRRQRLAPAAGRLLPRGGAAARRPGAGRRTAPRPCRRPDDGRRPRRQRISRRQRLPDQQLEGAAWPSAGAARGPRRARPSRECPDAPALRARGRGRGGVPPRRVESRLRHGDRVGRACRGGRSAHGDGSQPRAPRPRRSGSGPGGRVSRAPRPRVRARTRARHRIDQDARRDDTRAAGARYGPPAGGHRRAPRHGPLQPRPRAVRARGVDVVRRPGRGLCARRRRRRGAGVARHPGTARHRQPAQRGARRRGTPPGHPRPARRLRRPLRRGSRVASADAASLRGGADPPVLRRAAAARAAARRRSGPAPHGARDLRAPRGGAVGAACARGAAGRRRGGGRGAVRNRRPDAPGASGRPPRRGRGDQPRDGRRAVPQPQDRRSAPDPRLSQARRSLANRAGARARSGLHGQI
ncbi:MAG: hypothetical protein AVDCRST_MAG69-1627, partial [uncultured Solirubrobacteraceae bacterium]